MIRWNNTLQKDIYSIIRHSHTIRTIFETSTPKNLRLRNPETVPFFVILFSYLRDIVRVSTTIPTRGKNKQKVHYPRNRHISTWSYLLSLHFFTGTTTSCYLLATTSPPPPAKIINRHYYQQPRKQKNITIFFLKRENIIIKKKIRRRWGWCKGEVVVVVACSILRRVNEGSLKAF